jgi:hypothetical protein
MPNLGAFTEELPVPNPKTKIKRLLVRSSRSVPPVGSINDRNTGQKFVSADRPPLQSDARCP